MNADGSLLARMMLRLLLYLRRALVCLRTGVDSPLRFANKVVPRGGCIQRQIAFIKPHVSHRHATGAQIGNRDFVSQRIRYIFDAAVSIPFVFHGLMIHACFPPDNGSEVLS